MTVPLEGHEFHRPQLPLPPTLPPHLLAIVEENRAMWQQLQDMQVASSRASSRCTLHVAGYEGYVSVSPPRAR